MPDWSFEADEIRYIMGSLSDKTKKLSSLQSNILRRPSFDDNSEEEHQINSLASDIQGVSSHSVNLFPHLVNIFLTMTFL